MDDHTTACLQKLGSYPFLYSESYIPLQKSRLGLMKIIATEFFAVDKPTQPGNNCGLTFAGCVDVIDTVENGEKHGHIGINHNDDMHIKACP